MYSFRNILRKISKPNLFLKKIKVEKPGKNLSKVVLKKSLTATLASVLYRSVDDLNQFEVDVTKWNENQESVINLMKTLSDCIVESSQQYRSAIIKEIEMIDEATNLGAFSEKWDALPEYRLLAEELREEIDKYYTLIKTLGQIAHDQSLLELNSNIETFLIISNKYKELECILCNEIEENKKVEKMLLKTQHDSIIRLEA